MDDTCCVSSRAADVGIGGAKRIMRIYGLENSSSFIKYSMCKVWDRTKS